MSLRTLFSDYALPATLFLIIIGMGMSLLVKDFKWILRHPRAMLLGLFSQMVLLPPTAFLLVYLSPLDPAFKVGLVIVSACPGGAAPNLISHLLSGRLALSISLTAINSLFILATVPLLVMWAKLF